MKSCKKKRKTEVEDRRMRKSESPSSSSSPIFMFVISSYLFQVITHTASMASSRKGLTTSASAFNAVIRPVYAMGIGKGSSSQKEKEAVLYTPKHFYKPR